MLWVGSPLYPWKKMEYSCPQLQLTRWQWIFHAVPMILTKSMWRQGKILQSNFWYITVSNGWPCDQRQLPQELHLYWNFREDLSVKDGIATKCSRLLMLSTLQRKALEQILEGHQGVEKCMLKARESVFWPGISDDIQETVEKCGHLPVNFQSFQACRKHQWGSTPSMAYTGHQPILLE